MTGKKLKNPKAHIKLCMQYEITVMTISVIFIDILTTK